MAEESLSVDTAFDLCRSRYRRIVLTLLASEDRSLTVADLAKEIAVRDGDAEITDLESRSVTTAYQQLSHVHIPKLVDARVVELDEARERVRATPRQSELEPYLSVVPEPPSATLFCAEDDTRSPSAGR